MSLATDECHRAFQLAAKLASDMLTPEERSELANLIPRLLDDRRDAREALARAVADMRSAARRLTEIQP